MFEILNDSSASPEVMAKGYIEIENALKGFQEEHTGIYDRVIELQQQALSGKGVSKDLGKAKKELEAVSIKIEACQRGMAVLRDRMAEAIPVYAQERWEAIGTEYEDLSAKKVNQMKDALRIAAKCLVLFEEITGPEISYNDSTGETRLVAPSLKVEWAKLESNEKAFFENEVIACRDRSTAKGYLQTTNCKLSDLGTERQKIEEMLDAYDPEREVEKMIGRFRHDVEEPEVFKNADTVQEESGLFPSFDTDGSDTQVGSVPA